MSGQKQVSEGRNGKPELLTGIQVGPVMALRCIDDNVCFLDHEKGLLFTLVGTDIDKLAAFLTDTTEK